MATRNQTATFLSLRENYQRRQHGLNQARYADHDLEANPRFSLPPVWVDTKEACEALVVKIQDLMQRLDEAHRNRLVVRMDDEVEGAKDHEIDTLTRSITQMFRQAESKLREIAKIDNDTSDADLSVRVNVQRSMATRLQSLSWKFRKSQKEYLGKLKVQKQISPALLIEEEDVMSRSQASSAFLLSQEEQNEFESNSRQLRERDQEIERITKSIEDLALVFKHLASLVIEQGTILDRIDHNIDLVVDRTEHGVLELEKAESYQKSNRANWCIVTLVVLIIIFFGIILLKTQPK